MARMTIGIRTTSYLLAGMLAGMLAMGPVAAQEDWTTSK